MIDALYIHTLTISRPTRTTDGQGGWTIGYSEVAAISGRLRPKGASERTVAQAGQAEITHTLYCAADTDVQRGDLVSGEGKVVEVVAVREPSHMGHHLEVDCTEIQQAGEEAGS